MKLQSSQKMNNDEKEVRRMFQKVRTLRNERLLKDEPYEWMNDPNFKPIFIGTLLEKEVKFTNLKKKC